MRLPVWAVMVSEPASRPVTVSVAVPLDAVALPRPVTVPEPALFVAVFDPYDVLVPYSKNQVVGRAFARPTDR